MEAVEITDADSIREMVFRHYSEKWRTQIEQWDRKTPLALEVLSEPESSKQIIVTVTAR
jgi:hypothetical protein